MALFPVDIHPDYHHPFTAIVYELSKTAYIGIAQGEAGPPQLLSRMDGDRCFADTISAIHQLCMRENLLSPLEMTHDEMEMFITMYFLDSTLHYTPPPAPVKKTRIFYTDNPRTRTLASTTRPTESRLVDLDNNPIPEPPKYESASGVVCRLPFRPHHRRATPSATRPSAHLLRSPEEVVLHTWPRSARPATLSELPAFAAIAEITRRS